MSSSQEIEQWRNHRKASGKSHKQLLKQLGRKKGADLDVQAQEFHDKAFQKIDCLDCANCCSSIPPILNRNDINRVAKFLNIKPGEFEDKYVRVDEDGDFVINITPCPFLGPDNCCSVYEVRPKACREYPHSDGTQFSNRMKLHATNAQYCPAVFHILESFRVLTEKNKR